MGVIMLFKKINITLLCLLLGAPFFYIEGSKTPPRTPENHLLLHKRKYSELTTPKKIDFSTHNHCSTMITALNDGNLDLFKSELVIFFNSIPYTIRMDNQKHWQKFYPALFLCLFDCLYNASTTNIENYKSLKKNFYQTDNTLYCPLQADDTIYVLQFDYSNTTSYVESKYKYISYYDFLLTGKQIKVINIELVKQDGEDHPKLNVEVISNNGPTEIAITPAKLKYKSNNIFKQMITGFSQDNISSTLNILKTIYQNIPYNFWINKEKYYQSLFCCITQFIGNTITFPEFPSGQGRIDAIITTEAAIYIIEFKLHINGSKAGEALDQIKTKNYALQYENRHKPIYLIGLSIDTYLKNIKIFCKRELHQPKSTSPMKKRRKINNQHNGN